MSSTIKTVCAALSIALILAAMAGLNIVSAQSPVDYDANNDGLIEIEWLEQLNAIRWDLDGDGFVDDRSNAEAYSAAFPDATEGMGCADGCRGYELTRDLDFKSAGSYASGVENNRWVSGNGWLPIGVNDAFYAIFEGNERTIANLYIDRSGDNQPEGIGVFGSNQGELRRTGVVDVNVTGAGYTGGLVGLNEGVITDGYVTGSVSGGWSIGGLVGHNEGTIASSHAEGSISGEGFAGGLVGSSRGNITSSYAASSVVGEGQGSVGGLVGDLGYEGVIVSCYATGNVSNDRHSVGGLVGGNSGRIALSYATGSVAGGGNAGGLVARNGGTITLSYATGNVSSDGGYGIEAGIGGLVGWNGDSIVASYATGKVSSYVFRAGGLVGYNVDNIISSYSSSNVSGTRETGGLVGYNEGHIISSYSIGSVVTVEDGESHSIGGSVGKNDETDSLMASYWNTETSDQTMGVGEGSETGIEGKTTADLQEPTDYTGIYADWLTDLDNADGDFDETTGMDDVWDFGTSSQYPELKADLDDSGHASWWEFGSQHGRPQPTATPTPPPTSTPTPTFTPTVTPTPTQTATPTNTPIPTDTPTATPSPTMTPIPTDTPVPTGTAIHTAMPTDTTVQSNTPEPTRTPVPPTQTPVIIVVTATPSADAPSGGGCNSVSAVPAGTAAANLLFVVAPLGIIGGVKYRRRKMGSAHYE